MTQKQKEEALEVEGVTEGPPVAKSNVLSLPLVGELH